ncbi:MAG: rRNA maturation RNase YbeY [Burkholderiales bacterium]|nr:rRNA maturation RNase YbeY [Burkholderiales bacterium]MCA3229557.1 rRNA maturation RNase YbeY [Burkholderiales bacterium]
MRPEVVELAIQGLRAQRGLPARSTLRRWVLLALESTTPAQLTVRFIGRAEARTLNRDFRGRDYATNVLTFDYARAPLAADIVLCLPVIRREAREQAKTLRAHLAHLVIHGVLHARGFDHERPRAARQMEARERRLLAALRIADPYQPGRCARLPPGAAPFTR